MGTDDDDADLLSLLLGPQAQAPVARPRPETPIHSAATLFEANVEAPLSNDLPFHYEQGGTVLLHSRRSPHEDLVLAHAGDCSGGTAAAAAAAGVPAPPPGAEPAAPFMDTAAAPQHPPQRQQPLFPPDVAFSVLAAREWLAAAAPEVAARLDAPLLRRLQASYQQDGPIVLALQFFYPLGHYGAITESCRLNQHLPPARVNDKITSSALSR